jgi:hypothetical protein
MDKSHEARVAEMRRLRQDEDKTLAEIANRFGLTRQRVHQLIGDIPAADVAARRGEARRRQLARLGDAVRDELRSGRRRNADIRASFGLTQRELRSIASEDPLLEREHLAARRARVRKARAPSLRALKRVAREVGRTPGHAKYDELRGRAPSSQRLIAHHGSWPAVCRAAGLAVNVRPVSGVMGRALYSEDEYLERLADAYRMLGHWPTLREWQGPPSAGSYRTHFGSWMNAIARAQELV